MKKLSTSRYCWICEKILHPANLTATCIDCRETERATVRRERELLKAEREELRLTTLRKKRDISAFKVKS